MFIISVLTELYKFRENFLLILAIHLQILAQFSSQACTSKCMQDKKQAEIGQCAG